MQLIVCSVSLVQTFLVLLVMFVSNLFFLTVVILLVEHGGVLALRPSRATRGSRPSRSMSKSRSLGFNLPLNRPSSNLPRDVRGGGLLGDGGEPPSDTSIYAANPAADPPHNGKAALGLLGFLKALVQKYNLALSNNPYTTKIISSAIVSGLGDILIQYLTAYQAKTALKLDFRRLSVFMTVGGLYIAPVIHLWFNYLEFLPLPANLGKWTKSLIMIAADQTFGAVVITAGFFYAFELVSHIP